MNRIRRMFRWAVGEELVPMDQYHGLMAVEGIRKGREQARESKPVLPVDDDTIDATLPHLPAVVADMVRLTRLTGMRPTEPCQLRPADLDRSDEVRVYQPRGHKTEHHDRRRLVCVGPQAQSVRPRGGSVRARPLEGGRHRGLRRAGSGQGERGRAGDRLSGPACASLAVRLRPGLRGRGCSAASR